MDQFCECDSWECRNTFKITIEEALWLRDAHPNACLVFPEHVAPGEEVIGWDSAGVFAVVIGDQPHGISTDPWIRGVIARAELDRSAAVPLERLPG